MFLAGRSSHLPLPRAGLTGVPHHSCPIKTCLKLAHRKIKCVRVQTPLCSLVPHFKKKKKIELYRNLRMVVFNLVFVFPWVGSVASSFAAKFLTHWQSFSSF